MTQCPLSIVLSIHLQSCTLSLMMITVTAATVTSASVDLHAGSETARSIRTASSEVEPGNSEIQADLDLGSSPSGGVLGEARARASLARSYSAVPGNEERQAHRAGLPGIIGPG